jgi:hypothetical protein
MAREVVCITEDDGSDHNDCRCIESIQYRVNGRLEMKTKEHIYADIENRDIMYYVKHPGGQSELVPVEQDGTKYVRTEPTDTPEDRLMNQPRC